MEAASSALFWGAAGRVHVGDVPWSSSLFDEPRVRRDSGGTQRGRTRGMARCTKTAKPLRQLQLVATCHGGPGPKGGGRLTHPPDPEGTRSPQNKALSGGRPRKISQLPEKWDSGSVDAPVCLGEDKPDTPGTGDSVPGVSQP